MENGIVGNFDRSDDRKRRDADRSTLQSAVWGIVVRRSV